MRIMRTSGKNMNEHTMPHDIEYYYKGVKVSIWGKNDNKCTIVVEDKETADRLGDFERHDEGYLSWFYKTVNEEEVEVVESPTKELKSNQNGETPIKTTKIVEKKSNVQFITKAAVTAALYVILTFLSNAVGLASGLIQVRISEALVVFCIFSPAGIYGVTIGCLISNILTGCLLPDVIFGTLATLIGAIGTRILGRKFKYLAPLPTILSNALIIPFLLHFVYGFQPLWLCFITVFVGEAISCYAFGIPLYLLLCKNKRALGL